MIACNLKVHTMAMPHEGICHICGTEGRLTFEHIPPKAAFNRHPVLLSSMEEAFNRLSDDPLPDGTTQPKGMGGWTLCERCNNQTGHWYGGPFAEFCLTGMRLLQASEGRPTLTHIYDIRPLAVLKQIATMFFSVNSDRFHERHQDLVAFVLNKERRYLPPQYRFYIYYNVEGQLRAQGIIGQIELGRGATKLFLEITFPPFGYVLSINSTAPDSKLLDITDFSRFDYRERRMLQLKPTVLPTHLALPGDYRSKDEIYEQVVRSHLQEWVRRAG